MRFLNCRSSVSFVILKWLKTITTYFRTPSPSTTTCITAKPRPSHSRNSENSHSPPNPRGKAAHNYPYFHGCTRAPPSKVSCTSIAKTVWRWINGWFWKFSVICGWHRWWWLLKCAHISSHATVRCGQTRNSSASCRLISSRLGSWGGWYRNLRGWSISGSWSSSILARTSSSAAKSLFEIR